MKSDTLINGNDVNKKDRKDLSNETKGSASVDVKSDSLHRSFGLTDLWFIQKRQRTSASMLRRLQ